MRERGAELTPDYHERTRVQGAREVALILGMVLVLTLPVLIEQTNPENLAQARVASMGWFVLILLAGVPVQLPTPAAPPE